MRRRTRPIPAGASTDFVTRVLVEVLDQHRPTTRTIADAVDGSVAGVHAALHELRDAGLVDWVDGEAATLHPTCCVIQR